MAGFRPMKGWNKAFDLKAVSYPVFGSLKLDGIRALWVGKEFLSSTLNTIPNRNIQRIFSTLGIPAMWDGELIDGSPNGEGVYHRTESTVMSRDKDAAGVRFWVFDNPEASGGFEKRIRTLQGIDNWVRVLPQMVLRNPDEVQEYYMGALAEGYEGIVLRHPHGPYKHGRSTFREQYMLKLKPLEDAEAPIIGFEEMEHNLNEAEENNFGLTKRSSAQAGKVGANTLGAVIVDWHGKPLRIGCFKGISKVMLQVIWNEREKHMGRLVKFKYFPIGNKDLPRQPRMYGFRDKITL